MKARFVLKDALELEEQKKYLDASHEITGACESEPDDEEIIQAYERIIQQAILSEPEAGAWVGIFIAGVRVDFRWCPPTGNEGFKMGSSTDEKYRNDDETLHTVVITHGYWLAETETTQELWQAVMGENPSHFKGDHRPVEQICWNDCQEFIKRIQQYAPEGTKFKLPSEAHWEYACRAGTTSMYSRGNQYHKSHFGPETWYVNSSDYSNSWGLADMHGNVWEWCEDWYGNYSHEILENPTGPKTGSLRVIRGGSWREDEKDWRSARRGTALPNTRSSSIGFRLELSVDTSN